MPQVIARRRRRLVALALGAAVGAWGTVAEAGDCRPQPIRWEDDCSALANRELAGLDRLRYQPLKAAGDAWLTLGGEARVRVDSMDASDFGMAGGPSYVQVARRLLLDADLHLGPEARVFGQLATVDQDGRKPGPRPQDQDQPDVAQLFVDVPAHVGGVGLLARIGRQEINLSDNRLVTTRDGANMRRAFEGVVLDVVADGARLTLFRLNPVEIRRGAFDDRANSAELFTGASLDLPRRAGDGLTTLFLFDRQRPDAHFLDASGRERRWTAGARYARRDERWDVYGQAAMQWGQVEGQRVRALGGAVGAGFTYDAPHSPRLGAIFAFAGGDQRPGDGRVETFDPLYPNNYGLSDAPFLYQTNYLALAGEASARFGPLDLGAASYLVARYSTKDAIYGGGRPIAGSAGPGRPTALLLQGAARLALNRRTDIYASVVRAIAGKGVTAAGGADATYVRVQLTGRF